MTEPKKRTSNRRKATESTAIEPVKPARKPRTRRQPPEEVHPIDQAFDRVEAIIDKHDRENGSIQIHEYEPRPVRLNRETQNIEVNPLDVFVAGVQALTYWLSQR